MQPSNEREAVPFLQTSWPSSKVLFRSLCLQTCGFISAAESPWHVLIPFPYIFLLPCPPSSRPCVRSGCAGSAGQNPSRRQTTAGFPRAERYVDAQGGQARSRLPRAPPRSLAGSPLRPGPLARRAEARPDVPALQRPRCPRPPCRSPQSGSRTRGERMP